MTSWRDTASPAAAEDLDALLATVLPLAEHLLDKNGEMYPFGGLVSSLGESRSLTPSLSWENALRRTMFWKRSTTGPAPARTPCERQRSSRKCA